MANSGFLPLKVQKSFKNQIILFPMKSAPKIPLDTPNEALTTPAKLFCPKTNFITQSTKLLRNHLFFQSFSLSNFFSGHVDWSIGNPAVSFWQSQERFCSKCKKLSKVIVFPMKNAQKIPLDTPNEALTTPAKLFCPKSNFLTQSTKLLRNHLFFLFFLSNFSPDT